MIACIKALWPAAVLAALVAVLVAVCRNHPVYSPERVQAWDKVAPMIYLAEFGQATDRDEAVAPLKEFFADRRRNARAFAADVLSWSGRWSVVKGLWDADAQPRHVRGCFERHIFTEADLKAVVEAAVENYLTKLQGRENRLLVDIRADLADEALGRVIAPAADPEAFRAEFDALLKQAASTAKVDLGAFTGTMAVNWYAAPAAGALMGEVFAAVAVRLGLSGTVMGFGAASAPFTIGLSLVAGFLIDQVMGWLLFQFGHDPEGELADKLIRSLDTLESALLGDATPPPPLPERAWQVSDLWSTPPAPPPEKPQGLLVQLMRVGETRAKLREAALRAMILEGGAK